jgi:shikimate dehydrogenase
MTVSAKTLVAGVIGQPLRHSLSPLLHNAWLKAAGLDGVYIAFAPRLEGFAAMIEGFRGGAICGLNITLPFKEQALDLAQAGRDRVTARARLAGAANLVVFGADGSLSLDNTDGEGLLYAFARQAPSLVLNRGPVVILGAGGAARGAAAALVLAGVPEIRILNRTFDRAKAIAAALGDKVVAWRPDQALAALDQAAAVINATSLGLDGGEGPAVDWRAVPKTCVFMDMVYKPLDTAFLRAARARGHLTIDGLDMLVGQAIPSFLALFGQSPPAGLDVRALALKALAAEQGTKA